MNVIGIGSPGCALALEFKIYDEYEVFFVDHENKQGYDNFFKIPRRATHEEYEKKYRKINLKAKKQPTILILSGAGKISGIILRLLQQLKDNDLEVLYVKPDESLMTIKEKNRHKVVFGVLQQYARSGLIKKIYVVDNSMVEEVINNINIQTYWQDVNKAISSTFHMLNVFKNTEPLLTTFGEISTTSNICTFGVVSFSKLDEKIFYKLERPRCKKYFFGVTEETLNTEKNLLQKIRKFSKSKSAEEEKCDSSFAIYSTGYEQDYVYALQYATLVQEENTSLQK